MVKSRRRSTSGASASAWGFWKGEHAPPCTLGSSTDIATEASRIRLEPWGSDDFPLLERLNAPEMTEHLGGSETTQKLAKRQARYERLAEKGADRMFKIVDEATGEACGSVGYWSRQWRGEDVYEMGWGVLPEFQGRGIAGAAVREAVDAARVAGKHRSAHAFPSVGNGPSNAICRKAGFTLVGDCDFEYPPGHTMRCNDWRIDLTDRSHESMPMRQA